jgi:lipid-A-disaccharide synthase
VPRSFAVMNRLIDAARSEKPDALVVIDFPDFNFRLAAAVKKLGIPVIYYISPQLWAWRSYRARNIRRDVDLLLTILPFEPDWYLARGIKHVEFVGHPLTGEVYPRMSRAEFCARHRLDQSRPIISFLPGSRHKELQRILPPMLDAARIISRARAEAQFVVAVAPNRDINEVHAIMDAANLNGTTSPLALRIVQNETREALATADVAAVASGTATLEAALMGTPLVIVYKESSFNWHTLGRLINAEHYGLINLIAGERLATELMQDDFDGKRLSEELISLLDAERNREFSARLRQATNQLGTGGASQRAADAVLRAVQTWKKK